MTLDTRPAAPAEASPLEPTTPIKPSELLRLGRLLVSARAVSTLVRERRGTVIAACALGAMGVAAGVAEDDLRYGLYWWPSAMTDTPFALHPCACYPNRGGYSEAVRVHGIVAHLSDDHGGKGNARLGDYWPTARIADWLESRGL
jgi:hypothetical protein